MNAETETESRPGVMSSTSTNDTFACRIVFNTCIIDSLTLEKASTTRSKLYRQVQKPTTELSKATKQAQWYKKRYHRFLSSTRLSKVSNIFSKESDQ